MTRDILVVSAADVNCERVFNTAKTLYDHRKTYNSTIFFAYMMMRFHDQKKNLQAKLDVDLSIKKMTHEDLEKKMKKRVNELQHVYDERYISNDEEDDNTSNTNALKSTKIR
jgi:hypothetical protein